jgi:hypothetical protein
MHTQCCYAIVICVSVSSTYAAVSLHIDVKSHAAKPLIYDRTWKERNDLTDSKHKMRNVLLQTKLSHMHTDALPN